MSETIVPTRVRRRGFRFAQLPDWVMYHPDLSDRAKLLFAVLDRYAGASGECFPSRRTLAEKLKCSVDSIDRAKAELVAADALEVEKQVEGGLHKSNLYVVIHDEPDERGGRTGAATRGRGGAARGGRGGAALTRELLEQEDDDSVRVTEAGASTSSSSSQQKPYKAGAVWHEYARLVAAVRPGGVDNREAFVTSVARTASSERADDLARLRVECPEASVSTLARLLFSESRPDPVARIPPEDPARVDVVLDDPDEADVRTPAEVKADLAAARASLKKSGGRG